jgi:AraC-like DNA-binding protein
MSENGHGNERPGSPPKRFTFSTESVPAKHRFNAFRDVFDPIVELDWSSQSPADFACAVHVDMFDGVEVLDLQATELRGARNARQGGRAAERIAIHICNRGTLSVEQGGSAFDATEGHAAVVIGKAGHVNYARDTRILCLDSAVVRPLLKSDWPNSALHIPGGTPALRLLISWLANRSDVELLSDPILRALYVQHTADIVAMILGPHTDAQSMLEGRGIKAARVKAILNAITLNATRSDLSAAQIGRDLDISERYVRLLLEGTGKTFAEHLIEERLQIARKLLRAPHLSKHLISDIALLAGFSDISHFNRSFRRRFGDSPSGFRSST